MAAEEDDPRPGFSDDVLDPIEDVETWADTLEGYLTGAWDAVGFALEANDADTFRIFVNASQTFVAHAMLAVAFEPASFLVPSLKDAVWFAWDALERVSQGGPEPTPELVSELDDAGRWLDEASRLTALHGLQDASVM